MINDDLKKEDQDNQYSKFNGELKLRPRTNYVSKKTRTLSPNYDNNNINQVTYRIKDRDKKEISKQFNIDNSNQMKCIRELDCIAKNRDNN